jgi:hypothetical protein
MPEAVEQLHPLLAIATNGMVGRQVSDQLPDAGSELVGEVRSCWANEGVDVVDRRLGHEDKATRCAVPIRWMPDPGLRPTTSVSVCVGRRPSS